MNSRRHALALARRLRTCPPPVPAGRSPVGEQIEAHRRRCPLCAEQGAGDPWQTLADRLAHIGSGETAEPAGIEAGALCAVKPERAHWCGHLFFHPPLVLVLGDMADHPGAAEVAQVYHDPMLAAPGDLILNAPEAGGFDSIFVECWNRYPLRRADLAPPLARLASEVVDAVRAMAADPDALPDWAELPVPMADENDARIAFRRLEVEVGCAFAADAVAVLMDEMEDRAAPAPVEEVQAALRRLVPGVRWADAPADPEAALGFADWPVEAYPLAAAEEEPLPICARRVTLSVGVPVSVTTVPARLTQVEPLAAGLAVSGTVEDRPAAADGGRLLVVAVLPDGRRRRCDPVDWDPGSGFFYAEVPTAEADPEGLELTVLTESTDD